MSKRFYIKTYGCQMNEHDSRKIGAMLTSHGFAATETIDDADLVLFNTCTIRDKAEQKARSEIGRTVDMKAARPALMVGVCGCMAQQEKELLFDRFPHIDLLFGPDQIPQLPRLLETVANEHRQVAALDLINTPAEYEFLNLVPWGMVAGRQSSVVGNCSTSVAHAGDRRLTTDDVLAVTAFVTIMKGCDANCAYCIVPKVRGQEVCRPADDIIAEVQALASRGVREVTLLGQTVNTYGNRRHPDTMPFAQLLRRIATDTDIARIRFTSPHPKDVNADLAAEYRDNPKLCHHMHLPLQSGSDAVLRAMRRSYSCEQYLAKVDLLRAACPDIALTTDLIVGFPGENAADFAATLCMIETVGYDAMYTFKYSPRPGTESFARLTDDVPEAAKKERLAQLMEFSGAIGKSKLEQKIGQTFDVLVEGNSKHGDQWTGRTTHNTIVNFSEESHIGTSARRYIGTIQPVEITRAYGYSVEGVARLASHIK